MKTLIKNCLATTGLTIVLLAVIATFYQARFLLVDSIFQSFAVNALIHAGLILVRKFESIFFLVESLLEIGYVLLILIPACFLFGWYSSTPLWLVILMGIIVYTAGCFINVLRINNDINFINKQLQIRKRRKEDSI